MTRKRLEEAARIADKGGLDGEMLHTHTPDWLLRFFGPGEEGPGVPPITAGIVELIRQKLVPGVVAGACHRRRHSSSRCVVVVCTPSTARVSAVRFCALRLPFCCWLRQLQRTAVARISW